MFARSSQVLYLALAGALCLAGVAPVHADSRVPPIAEANLPVAGTCAPIRSTDVTHVRVGQLGWFLASGGSREPVNLQGLTALLKTRVGTAKPSTHSVWITASKNHMWAHIVPIVNACQVAGIYRVGIRVPSQDGKVLGFPLFLPARAEGAQASSGSATRLPLWIKAVANQPGVETRDLPDITHPDAKEPGATDPSFKGLRPGEKGPDYERSDPKRLYALAKLFTQKMGRIVAEVRMDNNVSLQYAVTVLDVLYRGGVAGVRVRYPTLLPNLRAPTVVRIRVLKEPHGKDLDLSSEPRQGVEIPPIAPRTEPWPIDGANIPGALYMDLEDINWSGKARAAAQRFDNVSRKGQLPNERVRRDIAAHLQRFTQDLGTNLLSGMRGGQLIKNSMVVRLREPEKLVPAVQASRDAFRDAVRVEPSTVRLTLFFFNGVKGVGSADVTVHIGADSPSFVFARWADEPVPANIILPPEPVDPFAAGVPGALRAWVETAFLRGKQGGGAAMPMTPPDEILAELPASYHDRVKPYLDRRASQFEALARNLRATRYDRLFVVVNEASAAVHNKTGVVGGIKMQMEVEEKALRIKHLKPIR